VQVATDNIALTGLNFFPVTRTVLLTVSIAGVMQVLYILVFKLSPCSKCNLFLFG